MKYLKLFESIDYDFIKSVIEEYKYIIEDEGHSWFSSSISKNHAMVVINTKNKKFVDSDIFLEFMDRIKDDLNNYEITFREFLHNNPSIIITIKEKS